MARAPLLQLTDISLTFGGNPVVCAAANAVIDTIEAEELLANVATHDRDEVVLSDVAPAGDGPVQTMADGRSAFRARVPGLGLAPATALVADDRVVVTDRTMTNGHLAVSWDLAGTLCSIIDVDHARELLPVGRSYRAVVRELVGKDAG